MLLLQMRSSLDTDLVTASLIVADAVYLFHPPGLIWCRKIPSCQAMHHSCRLHSSATDGTHFCNAMRYHAAGFGPVSSSIAVVCLGCTLQYVPTNDVGLRQNAGSTCETLNLFSDS
jgi:hypothetical protein